MVEPNVAETVVCYAVVLEEHDQPEPYGTGKLLNRECIYASRSHAKALKELEAQRQRWTEYSRFSVHFVTERIGAELAERLPA